MSEFITAIVMTITVCCHALPCSLTEISACMWRKNTPTHSDTFPSHYMESHPKRQ